MILFLEAYQLELGTTGPMVSAEGLSPGYLTWDSFGPHHLSALTAATEAKGQEPQKVFWKKNHFRNADLPISSLCASCFCVSRLSFSLSFLLSSVDPGSKITHTHTMYFLIFCSDKKGPESNAGRAEE